MRTYNYVFRYTCARNRMSSLEFHTLRKILRDYARIRCSHSGDVLVHQPDPGSRGGERGKGREGRAVGNYALNYKYRQGGLRETDYMVAT